MVQVAAMGAAEALGGPRSRIDMAACGAGLRAMSGRDFDQSPTLPFQLVAKHLNEARPARSENLSGQRILVAQDNARTDVLPDPRHGVSTMEIR
jgi:membrane-bound lytic murein transglycosylase MltF